jgi:uncharacterized protein involved in tolerance to divalent cations
MHCIVLSTFADKASAQKAAQKILDERLAACVSIIPGIESHYLWKGKMETSQEVQVVIKTSQECYDQLEKTLKEIHPYECPEIIQLKIEKGSESYLNWISENVR